MSECADDERDWFPQRHICQPTMQLEAARRIYGLLHEAAPYHDGSFTQWAKEPSRDFPFHFLDGVSIWMAIEDANPGDDFLTRADAAPILAKQADSQKRESADRAGDGG